ncbi:serine hydrolase domain-containing protein [Streptomyces sp. CB01580]|uniref:serine hydrolase domain-containing protein n=1 Tax=Streptomyces sp. CB01580 TaxID=1703933 RepID=UPI00093B1557|nr:beta-lactamase [Streptomyces sp. CB01580]
MHEQTGQRLRSSGRRRNALRAATAVAVVVGGIMAMSAPAPSTASAAPRPDTVQQGLNTLVSSDGVPGALASVMGRDGRTRTYTAGVGDLATGAKVPSNGQVRIGSNTKTFTAVVVLQLVAEGKIGLDASVDTYLPGLLRGDEIDGRRITVRQLLQHTSGLPNYTKYLSDDIRYYEPRELLDLALQHKADFAPGARWEYNNTNYLVAGLIVQKVTGRPLAEEMDRRVIKPLGLRHTYFPAPGEVTIQERHPKGYYQDSPGAPLVDATQWDPSWAWAAGQLVSTNADLNRFFSELLSGRLLPKAQLDQMRTTIPAGYPFAAGARYGLGLVSTPLSCDSVYWGHGGSITGYETRGGVTEDGRAVNVAVTMQPGQAAKERMDSIVDTALCR